MKQGGLKVSIVGVLATLAVANAGSVDVKVHDKTITITQNAGDGQSLVSPLTAKETLPIDVPDRTCHLIQKGFYGPLCVQVHRAEPCEGKWEKPLSCTASGWPVCCQGHSGGSSNNPYWYKAGQKCADLHPDGAAPFAPCKSNDAKTVVKTGASVLPVTLGALPDIVNGWNVSVGTERQRNSAAEFFGVKVSNDNSLWTRNIMTPFRGKTLRMTGIVIEKRNAFNTLIEHEVKNGNVTWTVEKGPQGVCGAWVEHINGGYTGVAHMAGWVSRNEWIENDNKNIFGHKIANDWGVVTATSATSTTVVMKYWSYQKAKFTMTWTLT